MKKSFFAIGLVLAFLFCSLTANAHFGMVIPSDNMVMQHDPRTIEIVFSFSHPFESIGMDLEKPNQVGVIADGKKADLLQKISPTKVMGRKAWKTNFQIRRPGAFQFFMEPKPYWEPAEDCFIIHYTKTVIAAFGDDEGWDGEIGLKTEIVPLSKPFALYSGNVFQGIVKINGKPNPFATVEVEFYNRDKKSEAPTDYMVTQTIRADANGVFTYAAPRAGWWGFAALSTADFQLKHDGKDKEVEIGAVIWVHFEPWVSKK